jgi:hypothetical protein
LLFELFDLFGGRDGWFLVYFCRYSWGFLSDVLVDGVGVWLDVIGTKEFIAEEVVYFWSFIGIEW